MTFLIKKKQPQQQPTQPTESTNKIIATPQDLINSQALDTFLKDYKLADTPESQQRRLQALARLNAIIQNWVHDEVRKLNIPDHEVKTYRAEVFLFGSFRLGVNSETGDIDLLCICPGIISRDSFFTTLRPRIELLPECKEFKAAPNAAVPIMTFVFQGVEIDLLFGQVAIPKLPTPFDVSDNNYLIGITDKDVKSLNGTRVTDKILSFVPIQASFRSTLRFLKMWAKKRGVYSNVHGFLGGVSYAIATAYVCNHNETEACSIVLRKFFQILAAWEWPKPLNLCEIEKGERFIQLNRALKPAWSPNPKDLCPIITPAFPCMNSSHNISVVTKPIFVEELKRGERIISRLDNESTPEIMREILLELIADPGFFTTHQHFFTIIITTSTESEMNSWIGFVESKIRNFVTQMYKINEQRGSIHPPLTLRPWPECFYDPTDGKYERHFYIGVKFNIPAAELKQLDFQTPFNAFKLSLNDLKDKTDTMCADVKLTRNYDLPDWVFPNSIRPDNIPRGPPKRKLIPPSSSTTTSSSTTATNTTTEQQSSNTTTSLTTTTNNTNQTESTTTTNTTSTELTNELQPTTIVSIPNTDNTDTTSTNTTIINDSNDSSHTTNNDTEGRIVLTNPTHSSKDDPKAFELVQLTETTTNQE